MKLWMELLDSGFSRPSYRELRNAFTTLICEGQKERISETGWELCPPQAGSRNRCTEPNDKMMAIAERKKMYSTPTIALKLLIKYKTNNKSNTNKSTA